MSRASAVGQSDRCSIVSFFMRTSPRHRRAIRIASRCLGLLFILGCSLALQETAQASCGDWLQGHATEGGPGVSIDQRARNPRADHSATPRRQPCRGPSCGRTPAAPAVPTSLPTRAVEHDRDAVLFSADVTDATGTGVTIPSDSFIARPVLAERLDRPPKRG